MKKKLSVIILIIAIVASLAVTFTGCSHADDSLVVYNWASYIGPDVIDGFESYYKELTGRSIDVTYSTFDTNETMITKIVNGDAKVDVICPSEYAIQRLLSKDCLLKLDKSNIDTLSNVDSDIYDKVSEVFSGLTVGGAAVDMTDYLVPYMWGTLGILYNADVVTEADLAEGWGLLWNAADNSALNGKILMKDSIRDSYAAAVMYLKDSATLPAEFAALSVQELINCTDADMITAAENALKAQKPMLKGYEVDFGKDDMIEERAYVDLAWSGDAFYAIETAEAIVDEGGEAPNLAYFVPDVGANVWFDGWVIPDTCSNKNASELFLQYINLPEVAMANAMEIGYTSAVSAEAFQASEDAMALLEDTGYDATEFFADELRYPTVTDTNLGVMQDFGTATESEIVAMWERVKGASSGEESNLLITIMAVCGGIVVVTLVALFLIHKFKPKRRARQ